MNYLIILCMFWAIIPATQASWFTAEGSAPIVGGDKGLARQQAAKDALRQIVLKSGASFSSLQELHQGMLVEDKFLVRAQGDIQMTQILSERVVKERLYVKVRAFIVGQKTDCGELNSKKTLSLVRFHLKNVQDLSDGALVNFSQIFSKNLFDTLNQNYKHIQARYWFDFNFALDPTLFTAEQNQTTQKIHSLAMRTKSQYMLLGIIDDVSIQYPKYRILQWTQAPIRHLKLRVYLFDSLSNTLVHSQNYDTQANWTFDPKIRLTPSDAHFWSSPFGIEVHHVTQKIAEDLNGVLACQATKGKVIQITDTQLRINLGRMHGLTLGQKIFIERQYQYSLQGHDYPLGTISDIAFEVIQLSEETAMIKPNGFMPNNIQINDWALTQHDVLP